MSQAIKTLIRYAAIATGIALILALNKNILFPSFDLSLLSTAVGHGRAILQYYCGPFEPLLDLGIVLLSFRFVVIPLIRVSIMIPRIILHSNS